MAKVKITGHASGTGILTVTAPNTSTDRTITLPDATGTLLNSDGSGASLTALNATQLTSGTVPTARLGSGTASSGTILYGDQTYKAAPTSFDPDGAVVFNESSADVDFRIESNDKSHMFFVDGGTNRIMIGSTGAPDVILDVHGTVNAGASTDEVIQEWSIGSDNVKANIEYTDVTTSRGMNFGTSTSHDLILKTNDTTRLTLTSTGLGRSQFTFAFWASVNQTGTQAILDSHNLSSITDNNVGDTTFTFSTAMPDTTYCALQPGTNNNAGGWFSFTETTYCRFRYYENSYVDVSKLMVAVVGDN